MERKTELAMAQLMLPFQANLTGNVHGGEILKFMDNVAGATARQYSRTNVVTARVDEIQFLSPIAIGSYVSCIGKIAYVGRSSMEVIVTVDVEDFRFDEPAKRALSAFFTMVALDDNGTPVPLPKLKLTTQEEKDLYDMAENRRRTYKRHKSAEQNK